MKKSLTLLTLFASLALTGCTTTTFNPETVRNAPADRVYIHQEPLPDEAIVEVVRLNNFGGSGCYLTFLINEDRAARLDFDERATFHLKAGDYVFQNTMDWDGRGLCGICSEEWARNSGQIRRQKIEPGRKYTFRMGINSWSGVMRLYMDKEGVPIH